MLLRMYHVMSSITIYIALQVPIAVSVTLFEAICLYKGTRVIASKGKEITNWKLHQIFLYCSCGIVAGMVGGLLGLGGGFILGPLFLELGIPPQVCYSFITHPSSCLFISNGNNKVLSLIKPQLGNKILISLYHKSVHRKKGRPCLPDSHHVATLYLYDFELLCRWQVQPQPLQWFSRPRCPLYNIIFSDVSPFHMVSCILIFFLTKNKNKY